MPYISYEVVPVDGRAPEQFDHLRETVEYLREKLYENFYINIETDYDHSKVVDRVQREIWDVLQLTNVDDIS